MKPALARMRAHLLLFLLIGGWVVALGSFSASAKQPPAPVKMLLDFLRIELEIEPKVGALRSDGGDIVLQDVLFGEMRKDGEPVLTARAREIRLAGAGLRDGVMHYRRISVVDLVFRFAGKGAKEGEIRIPGIVLAQASLLPRENAADPREELAATQLLASEVEIPDIVFAFPGVPEFHWRDIEATWRGDRRTGAGETLADFGVLEIPALEIARLDGKNADKAVRQLRALGLETITFGGMLSSTSTWIPDQRLMVDSDLRLSVREAGELRIVLDKLALPLALLRQGSDIRRKLGRKGADSMSQGMGGQAPGTQAPGQMPGQEFLGDPQLAAAIRDLALGGLTLAWSDYGLTRRITAMEASRLGVAEEEYIAATLQGMQQQLSAALPAQLVQMILREVSKFLLEPKSLRISVRGAGGQPVSVPGLMMFLVAPQMLLNALSIEVKANE